MADSVDGLGPGADKHANGARSSSKDNRHSHDCGPRTGGHIEWTYFRGPLISIRALDVRRNREFDIRLYQTFGLIAQDRVDLQRSFESIDTCTHYHDVVGVGIDLVKVRDVRDSLGEFGERYLRRLFTNRELSDCCSSADPIPAVGGAIRRQGGHDKGAQGERLSTRLDVDGGRARPFGVVR